MAKRNARLTGEFEHGGQTFVVYLPTIRERRAFAREVVGYLQAEAEATEESVAEAQRAARRYGRAV